MTDDRETVGPGLYVHIPFCARKCYYCDFTAYFHRTHTADQYVDDLVREIELYSRRPDVAAATFRSVFIGGGTPSILTPGQIRRVITTLRAAVQLSADAEVSLEANPEDLSAEKLACWYELGINRLSIGVQVTQSHLLQALGRAHDWDAVASGCERARAAGFENINIDLMYGVPGQGTDDWLATLTAVLALRPSPPEHVSCYGLQVEADTTYGRWQREGRLSLPGDEAEKEMYETAIATLTAAGFEHYELSNFARPGRHSRHNLNYWADGDFLGLGAGAWSHWAGRRFGNERFLRPYGEAVRSGRLPIATTDEADERTRMADAVMLGTRLIAGMPLAWFTERFGVGLQAVFGTELDDLAGRGLIRVTGGRLQLTRQGRLLANEVWAALL